MSPEAPYNLVSTRSRILWLTGLAFFAIPFLFYAVGVATDSVDALLNKPWDERPYFGQTVVGFIIIVAYGIGIAVIGRLLSKRLNLKLTWLSWIIFFLLALLFVLWGLGVFRLYFPGWDYYSRFFDL